MEFSDLQQRLLDFVRRPEYRPMKPRMIARRLGLEDEAAADLKKVIKQLAARGQLRYGAGHLVQWVAPGPRPHHLVGVFRRTEAGHGFVRPQESWRDIPDGRDIFVPYEKTGDASTGDTVAVRLLPSRGDLGPCGEVVEVLRRETHRFVGTYTEASGGPQVQIDGNLFTAPILVGDPGAKRLQSGDKVVVEMVRFPTPWRWGEGVVVEVLGPPGKPGVDTLVILREFDLPDQFAADALEEARRQAEAFDEEDLAGRLDLTQLPTITIDPIDARDYDDAVSLERVERGHWRLGVHIADVAHFVRPGTPLDREARHRATSVYLPDRVIPMLPETISNALASLQPHKLRYTKTVFLEFTEEGVPVHMEVHRSAIRSHKRLTYERVDAFFGDPEPWRRRWGAGLCELLLQMRELARRLRRRRAARGMLEMNIPEVQVELDRQGRVTGAHVVPHTESRKMIEEFMVAANQAVAEWLAGRGILFLRRIHRPPSLHKLKALREFVAELRLPGRDGGALENRASLQRLLDQTAGRPEEQAVHFAVLRAMQRAVYSPEEEGHYALASDCYCHFTSPIRRYPDLTVHRLVDEVLAGRKPRTDPAELLVLGDHCSQREQRAEAAERELTRLKLLAYFSTRIGEEMDAVITGVEPFGMFVQGLHLPAEGLIHIDSLADDFYRFDRAAHSLSGYRHGHTYRLGDVVRVAVAHVDMDRRELDFRLVQGQRGEKRPPQRADTPQTRRRRR